jgi:hypothetical protein
MKLGIEVSQRTVGRLMGRARRPPSQTWLTFLDNHAKELASMDFFTVPTASFGVLYVLVALQHDRRRIAHVHVTAHPTAEWTAQRIVEAFPRDDAPLYLLRDRDGIYGDAFSARVRGLGIEEIKCAPRSPWQNPFVERLVGTLRRELTDHVIVLDERHLLRLLRQYVEYHNATRTHLSLEKDAPLGRAVHGRALGQVVAIPQVGGLHHRYERRAAWGDDARRLTTRSRSRVQRRGPRRPIDSTRERTATRTPRVESMQPLDRTVASPRRSRSARRSEADRVIGQGQDGPSRCRPGTP